MTPEDITELIEFRKKYEAERQVRINRLEIQSRYRAAYKRRTQHEFITPLFFPYIYQTLVFLSWLIIGLFEKLFNVLLASPILLFIMMGNLQYLFKVCRFFFFEQPALQEVGLTENDLAWLNKELEQPGEALPDVAHLLADSENGTLLKPVEEPVIDQRLLLRPASYSTNADTTQLLRPTLTPD